MKNLAELSTISLGGVTLAGALSAVITLLVCLIVIRIMVKMVDRLLRKSKLDERLQRYLLLALKMLLYIVAAIIVIDALGVKTTSLVALLSVASLGVTLAAEDILGNMAGGLVLLTSRPFVIGDYIEAEGVTGTVEEITLNRTKLLTVDGLTVLVPNKALSAAKLTNYTSLGRRRVCQKISASYDAPTEAVKAACFAALAATPDKLEDPAPSVYLTEYGSSAIEYSVYCWTTSEHYLPVLLALGENLRGAFAEHGVQMTYDHLNVHVLNQ